MNLDELKEEARKAYDNGEFQGMRPRLARIVKHIDNVCATEFKKLFDEVEREIKEEVLENPVDQATIATLLDATMEFGLTTFAANAKATSITNAVLKGSPISEAEQVFDHVAESKYLHKIKVVTEKLKRAAEKDND